MLRLHEYAYHRPSTLDEAAAFIREHEDAMRRLFPRTRKVVVKDAGHWVHAQKPGVVVDVLRRLAAG